MIHSQKHILFVSHDASRTGAPIVLLHFLKWLKKTGEYNISIYLKSSGELENVFESISTTYKPVTYNCINRITRKLVNKVFPRKTGPDLPKKLSKQKFDLIYLNTVNVLSLVQPLKKRFECPVICHIHENEYTLQCYYPDSFSDQNMACVNHFIAVSESTRNNLINTYFVNPDKVKLAYEFIPLDEVKRPTVPIEEVRKELGLQDEFVVGGSGLTSWRKGVDLFISLAVAMNKLQPENDVKLIWVGLQGHESACQFLYESKRQGIEDKVLFVGEKDVPQNYFQLFDVLALTSREDPFPLVALEVAALQKPIVCFRNSGGIPELLAGDKGGIIVEYGDVEEMAAAILSLKEHEAVKLQKGREAAALAMKFDVNVVSRQISQIIADTI